MGRPKKNTPEQTSSDFNYQDDDAMYQKIMSGAPADLKTSSVNHAPEFVATTNVPEVPASAGMVAPLSSIYFVEGKIRLDQDGSGAIFSDQRRVVNASNVDEAIQKFVNYFVGMSNPVQRYTVITVAASETIL